MAFPTNLKDEIKADDITAKQYKQIDVKSGASLNGGNPIVLQRYDKPKQQGSVLNAKMVNAIHQRLNELDNAAALGEDGKILSNQMPRYFDGELVRLWTGSMNSYGEYITLSEHVDNFKIIILRGEDTGGYFKHTTPIFILGIDLEKGGSTSGYLTIYAQISEKSKTNNTIFLSGQTWENRNTNSGLTLQEVYGIRK